MTALEKMKTQNLFTKETLVWKDGMNGWTPAGQVKELASVFEEKKPAPAKTAPAKTQPPAVAQETKPAVPPAPPAPPKPQVSIYAIIDGAQSGPYDWDALEDMKSKGKLTTQTLVWEEGMDGWMQAKEVKNLELLFTQSKKNTNDKKPIGRYMNWENMGYSNSDYDPREIESAPGQKELTEKDRAFIEKILYFKWGIHPGNKDAMWSRFVQQKKQGKALAISGSVVGGVGLGILPVGAVLAAFIPFIGIPIAAVAGIMFITGCIVTPMCAIPFSRMGKIAKIYHRVSGEKFMSFNISPYNDGNYSRESKEITMAMAIRL